MRGNSDVRQVSESEDHDLRHVFRTGPGYDESVKIYSNFHVFSKDIYILVRSPVFLMLTLIGNSMIGLSGTLFYLLESGKNPQIRQFIDAIWWGFATATTTGYGDITPVTVPGKILGILLMLMGTALFAMYTGLFAEIILTSARKNR